MTEAYPDIIESLLDAIDVTKIDSMIVDSEIVGFDP
jgi:DNA ligase-1